MHQPLPVLRATSTHEAGLSASALRRRSETGGPHRLVRVAPNAFVDGAAWDSAGPRTRYVTVVHARLGRARADVVASHASAAALHGLPWLDAWPRKVHLTVPLDRRLSQRTGVVVHAARLDRVDADRAGRIGVTTPVRTAVDVALTSTVRSAVVVADAVLASGADSSELVAALERRPAARAQARARWVIDFADGAAGSPAESLARVVFAELGLPAPLLQHEFVVDGSRYAVDFWFPGQGVVVEIDGRSKYTDARLLRGRDPVDVFLAEKRRHEALLTVAGVRRIVRFEWRDLLDPARVRDRLAAAGLPFGGRRAA